MSVLHHTLCPALRTPFFRALPLTICICMLWAPLSCQRPADRTPPPELAFPVQPEGGLEVSTRDSLSVVQAAQFNTARTLHLEGVDGDDAAAERALELLIELHKERPEHPEILAYLGSARVLAAKRMFAPWSKGATCKDGLRLLDIAINLAPKDPVIRFLRAVSTYPLPGFFGRADQSAEDFARLREYCERFPAESSLTPEMAATALYHDGLCRQARSDQDGARDSWLAAMERSPGGRAAGKAREELGDLARSEER